ncbi:MAG: helix-turn-helix domain-containing protein [Candidatus Bathyarchaeota archaeon]|nr:helix-turn-helix domain-containing protein [Candidatus Termiticorpusculum sp.]
MSKLIFNTSEEYPIYAGDFEVKHKGCPFVQLSQEIEEDIPLDILSVYNNASKLHRVRFSLRRTLSLTEVDKLKNKVDHNVSMLNIWANGITKVELECKEPLLDAVMPITKLTFGDVQSYVATMDNECFRLIAPSAEEISGKERLLKIEDDLKSFGSAELVAFHRFSIDDLDSRIANILGEGSKETWLTTTDITTLETAYKMGYFESPRRCELKDLATELGISVTVLNGKLRAMNRILAEKFLEKAKKPLPPY